MIIIIKKMKNLLHVNQHQNHLQNMIIIIKKMKNLLHVNETWWFNGSNLNVTQFFKPKQKKKKKGAYSHIKHSKYNTKNTRETPVRQPKTQSKHHITFQTTTYPLSTKYTTHIIHIRPSIPASISPTKYDNNNKKNEKF
eukprot:73221_1